MIPTLIRSLRTGGAVVNAPPERMQPFLDAIYQLHIAAIRPQAVSSPTPSVATPESLAARAAASSAESAGTVRSMAQDRLPARVSNIYDFVSEIVVGTWLAFNLDGQIVNARLSWISPVRTKYIFTSRVRGKALVLTPEELAWQLGAGIAELVVEPVPLFDRAVSAALDELAAKKPPARAEDSVAAAVL